MNKVVGFAMCGSFCTFSAVIPQMETLKKLNYDIVPIMSTASYTTDTRFGKASDFIDKVEKICGNRVIHTIKDAEPIGPKGMFDILVIAPCTGNTLGKLANGINDTPVTMAAKSHLRNARPMIVAVSTNDALSTAAKNIGTLLNYRNIYFVPMSQDDSEKKPRSIVADFKQIPKTVDLALKGKQIQPIVKGEFS